MPNKMARYIEWQSGGRLTGRAAYAIGKQNLPEPVAGAEWQIDSQFSAADEILRDPSIKDIFQAVIANGVKVVMWRRGADNSNTALCCSRGTEVPHYFQLRYESFF
jgi:hypothetical protein